MFRLLFVLFFAVSAYSQIQVIPKPRQVEPRQGVFPLRPAAGGGYLLALPPKASDDDRYSAQMLVEEMRGAGSANVGYGSGDGQIVFSLTGAPEQVGDEGYVLDVTPERITLTARTSAGLFYGVQTLRQLVRPAGIPAVRVTDWPAMRWRGIQDDISRGPIPTLDYIKRQLRTFAEFKLNLYSLYIEHTFAYANHPLIGPRGGSLTEAEVREIVAYARKHHIEIVPEQQAFGHLHHALKWEKYSALGEVPHGHVLSPANPETYKFVKSLYDELVPLFPGRFLHIGSDETQELGTGQTKEMAEKLGLGRVYFDHISRVRQLLAPYNKRLMFWGDIALEYPDLLKQVPKDLIVATWDYNPRESFDKIITPFRNAGLDVFVCPGVNNWSRIFPNLDNALPNIRNFVRDGQKNGAIGVMNTTWDDDGEALFAAAWYPVLYGAAASWEPAPSEPEVFRRSFDWAFFRNPDGTQFADAVLQLNSIHKMLRDSKVNVDGVSGLYWFNPFRPEHRRRLEDFRPVAREMRLASESVLESIERNRPRARRNADQLEAMRVGALRFNYVGLKSLYAKRIADLYQEAYDNRRDAKRAGDALVRITQMNGLLQDGRDFSTYIKDAYRGAWLAENRPYWLDNVLAMYDRDTQVWLDKIADFASVRTRYRFTKSLPPPEELGLVTPPTP